MKHKCIRVAIAMYLIQLSISNAVIAAEYELEVCQFISTIQNSDRQSVSPGLDEPLNCDHKCFYDELGLSILRIEEPNLQDMYSIGWRLIHIVRSTFENTPIWMVYLEREQDDTENDCERTYFPKSPSILNN